nr:MAG TPA: hypothetical protein [Caudoviricetes sp.]
MFDVKIEGLNCIKRLEIKGFRETAQFGQIIGIPFLGRLTTVLTTGK